jgi:hypothetical protein
MIDVTPLPTRQPIDLETTVPLDWRARLFNCREFWRVRRHCAFRDVTFRQELHRLAVQIWRERLDCRPRRAGPRFAAIFVLQLTEERRVDGSVVVRLGNAHGQTGISRAVGEQGEGLIEEAGHLVCLVVVGIRGVVQGV